MTFKKKIYIVTTVPETLLTILRGQPGFLNSTYDITLISSEYDHMTSLKTIAEAEGVNYHAVNMTRGISPLKDLKSIFNLSLFLWKNKPDLIHSFTPKAGFISALSSFICRVKLRLHTFTGLIFPTSTGVKKCVLWMLDKLVVYLNTNTICEGVGVWQQLKQSNINDLSFNIIGNGNIAGVDCEYFELNNLDINMFNDVVIKPDTSTYLYVGRLNNDKGLFELVRAFKKLGPCSELLIVGAMDLTLPIDQETIDLIENTSNIHHLGFKSDVRPYMAVADVIVLPSYREGFPNVLLQAGAMSLPSIVTDVSGSNEIIINGYNGWIVKKRSISSLYNAFIDFESLSSDELKRYAMNSRENVVSKYDRKFYHVELVRFYNSLLK